MPLWVFLWLKTLVIWAATIHSDFWAGSFKYVHISDIWNFVLNCGYEKKIQAIKRPWACTWVERKKICGYIQKPEYGILVTVDGWFRCSASFSHLVCIPKCSLATICSVVVSSQVEGETNRGSSPNGSKKKKEPRWQPLIVVAGPCPVAPVISLGPPRG